MAGEGSRFSDVGYPMPKPLIEVENKHVIEWTTKSLPFIDHYKDKTNQEIHFAIREEDEINFSLSLRLKKIYGKKIKINKFKKITRGNLETAYIVAKKIKNNKGVLILDSDNHYDGSSLLSFISYLNNYYKKFSVICDFEPPDNNPKWAYAIKDGYKVVDILEKDKRAISMGGRPIVGVFYFSGIKDFLCSAEFIIQNNELVKNEFFMSQAIKLSLNSKIPVFSLDVKNVVPLGTPEDIIKVRETEYSKFLNS